MPCQNSINIRDMFVFQYGGACVSVSSMTSLRSATTLGLLLLSALRGCVSTLEKLSEGQLHNFLHISVLFLDLQILRGPWFSGLRAGFEAGNLDTRQLAGQHFQQRMYSLLMGMTLKHLKIKFAINLTILKTVYK